MSSTSLTMTESEHDLTLAISGDVETVRSRLIKALQTLDYKVLGEQPLYAKRSSRCAARYDCSLNVLDYQTTLTIALKQMNDVAVVATFNYEIKSFMHMTGGDRQTLAREAEALAALATERLAVSNCPACGTQINDESHFCRRCGAPLVLELAELEVLRLTRGARASYHNIFVGVIGLLLAALTALPLFLVYGARIYAPLMFVGIPLGSYALFVLLQGVWQLHRTLNPKPTKAGATGQAALVTPAITTALPPRSSQASITEGTTELLTPRAEHRVAEPIERKNANTSEVDSDHLM